MNRLSLKHHLFFRVLLHCTLNPHQNQGLIRFLFIWTLDPIQRHLGDLFCPRFQETDKFILNQPSKSIEKTIRELLKSTSNCELETMSLRKFCFLEEDLLNGELEMRENQPQFDKNIGMEHVLEQCHKVREISIGRNRRFYVTFFQYIKDNPASTYVQIRFFCRKDNNEFRQVTYVGYTLDEFKELIQNLKDFSNIQQCTFQ